MTLEQLIPGQYYCHSHQYGYIFKYHHYDDIWIYGTDFIGSEGFTKKELSGITFIDNIERLQLASEREIERHYGIILKDYNIKITLL